MNIGYVLLVIAFYWNVENINSLGVIPQSVEAFSFVTEYYWRDFNGLIPSDAIVGGKDANDANTYIGQFNVLAEYGQYKSKIHLLPATIKNGKVAVYAPYYGRVVNANDTANVKILCSAYTRRFSWYSPSSVFPTSCRLVITGNEDQSPMYTGKASVGKEVITGKIFADTLNHRPGLTIPLSNGQLSMPDTYQVLTYCT